MDIPQIMIAILGCSAIYFVSFREFKKRRWAYIFGLLNQPFWYWTAYEHQQWGIFVLSLWYTYSWSRGFYLHWILKEEL